jgi:hypothetical protein
MDSRISEDDLHHKIIDALKEGEDPKELVQAWCRPLCLDEKAKVERCEAALRIVKSADPEKSCLYRYARWAECMENCVQPRIWHNLKGASDVRKLDGFIDTAWTLRYLMLPLWPLHCILHGLKRTQIIEADPVE